MERPEEQVRDALCRSAGANVRRYGCSPLQASAEWLDIGGKYIDMHVPRTVV